MPECRFFSRGSPSCRKMIAWRLRSVSVLSVSSWETAAYSLALPDQIGSSKKWLSCPPALWRPKMLISLIASPLGSDSRLSTGTRQAVEKIAGRLLERKVRLARIYAVNRQVVPAIVASPSGEEPGHRLARGLVGGLAIWKSHLSFKFWVSYFSNMTECRESDNQTESTKIKSRNAASSNLTISPASCKNLQAAWSSISSLKFRNFIDLTCKGAWKVFQISKSSSSWVALGGTPKELLPVFLLSSDRWPYLGLSNFSNSSYFSKNKVNLQCSDVWWWYLLV